MFRSTLARVTGIFLLMAFLPLSAFALVNSVGSDETHDIATWNWEHFPLNGNLTVNYLTILIEDLELDLICVQEMESINDFNQLLSNLGGWDGIYSPDDYGSFYLKTGVLWNEETVSVGDMVQLFPDEGLTRPPIQVPVTMHENGDTLEFNLIVWHLKAGVTTDDITQRRHACTLAHDYILDQVENGDQPNWMIAGDWNGQLNDTPSRYIFGAFDDDPENWDFLTEWMVGQSQWASIGDRLIDHIMITTQFSGLYEEDVECRTLRLDNEWGNYHNQVSDHRPVAAFFPASQSVVGEMMEPSLPAVPKLSAWPVPANAGVMLQVELPIDQQAKIITITDIQGRVVDQLPVQPGTVTQHYWQPGNAATGMYFVRLEAGNSSIVQKIILMK